MLIKVNRDGPTQATASISLPLDPGSGASVRTQIDNEAWAVSTLDTALANWPSSTVTSHQRR
jgi:hypothetical protein